jgi:hypothetical protein
MFNLKKRRTVIAQEGDERKATSSYGILKTKYAACKCEVKMDKLQDLVEELRTELQDTKPNPHPT